MNVTKKRKFDFNDYFEAALYILAAVCFLYFLPKGNKPKIFQPILIIAVLTLIKVIKNILKLDFFPALRFSMLAFIFVAMFLANEFDFYSLIPGLDKIEHLFSGVILAFIGLVVFEYINRNERSLKISPSTKLFFSLFFSIAMAGCWEIYEFTTDHLFGLRSQNNSLLDTMTDIICGTVGAIIAYIYLRYNDNKKLNSNH